MTEPSGYYIYAKDQCLYEDLTEEEFKEKWEELKMIIRLLKTDYTEEDLNYIKLPANSGGNGSPGNPSY